MIFSKFDAQAAQHGMTHHEVQQAAGAILRHAKDDEIARELRAPTSDLLVVRDLTMREAFARLLERTNPR